MRLPAGSLKVYDLTKHGSARLSKHLTVKEFRSYSSTYKKLYTNEIKIYSGLPEAIEKLMTYIGADKVVIVNGYRCPAHNKAVGGGSQSAHLYGYAADAKFYKGSQIISGKIVCCGAETVGFSGVGYMSGNSVHLDVSPTRMWYGDETKKESGAYYSLTKHKKSFYDYFNLQTKDVKASTIVTAATTTTSPDYSKVSGWASAAWNAAIKSGLTDGSNPGKQITREQALTLIMRKMTNTMSLTLAQAWSKARAAGYTDGTNPKYNATREQIVTFIYRILENKPNATISQAWDWGIKQGITDGTNPKKDCTREQMIVMLSRI